jgi:hypothetical protein
MPQQRRITFTVPADLHARLGELADAEGQTVDEFVANHAVALAAQRNPPRRRGQGPSRIGVACLHANRMPERKLVGLERCRDCGEVVAAK